MKRRALIIYCNNTESGSLNGPIADNLNLRNHLTSYLGGHWFESEILSLNNPSIELVVAAVNNFLNNADYTFTVFSGHGFMNTDVNNLQYLELSNGDLSILKLKTNARRQTMIIDACRGFYSPSQQTLVKGLRGFSEAFIGDPMSTRTLFETGVLSAEEGITVLYAAYQNQSAGDSDKGGLYTYSLLKACKNWEERDRNFNFLNLKDAHTAGTLYMHNNFITSQQPTMNEEKRMRYFPLAVKIKPFYG